MKNFPPIQSPADCIPRIARLRERTTAWRHLVSIVCLAFIPGHAARLLAGAPYGGTGIGDVVVAVIKKVEDGPHTNANPPILVIEVTEVLRGDKKLDRSAAVWEPHFHGVDWGDAEKNPIFLAWQKGPLTPPKAGGKFILWGWMEPTNPKAKAPPRFGINPFHRYPYSDEKRKWAVETIRQDELGRKKHEQEQQAVKEKAKQAAAAWRKSFTPDKLGTLTGQAENIVVGRITSGPQMGGEKWLYEIEVVEWVKSSGPANGKDRPKHIQAWVSKAAGEYLYPRTGQWVLFLPARPESSAPLLRFHALSDGAAAVQSDEQSLALIRAAVPK